MLQKWNISEKKNHFQDNIILPTLQKYQAWFSSATTFLVAQTIFKRTPGKANKWLADYSSLQSGTDGIEKDRAP